MNGANTAERPAVRPSGGSGTAVNAGLGAVFALVLVLAAAQYAREGRAWGFDAGVGAVLCAVALLRGRGRGRAAAGGLALATAAAVVAPLCHLPGEPGGAAVLALFVLGSSAVRSLQPRAAVGVAAAGTALMGAGLLAADLIAGTSGTPFRIGIQAWCVALGTGLGLRFLDYRRRTVAETVRRDERLALARELHDVVAHHVTGIVLQTQAARIVARRDPGALDGTLAGIEEAGTEALAAMRRVVGLLRDSDDGAGTAPGAPGPEQLAELVRRFDGHGPAVSLLLSDDPAPWPPEVTSTVYRVVQEALTNIARHAAHARSATVSVGRVGDGVTVEITDDALPGPARHLHPGGFGLVGMRERVEALGGTLRAGPVPGAGWSVRATVPVPAGERR